MKSILFLLLAMLVVPAFGQSPDARILSSSSTDGLPFPAIAMIDKRTPPYTYMFLFSCYPDMVKDNRGLTCSEVKAPNNGLLSASFVVNTDPTGNIHSISSTVPAASGKPLGNLSLQEENLRSDEGLKAELPKAARNLVDFIEKRNAGLKGADVLEHICKILRAQLQGRDSIE